jgi:hypothetical protein
MSDTMKLQCELDHKTQEVAELQAEIARLKKILEMDNGLRARWLFDDCERYRAEIERLKESNEKLYSLLHNTAGKEKDNENGFSMPHSGLT